MNTKKIFLSLTIIGLSLSSCKKDNDNAAKKEVTIKKEIVAAIEPKKATFEIKGMTCAIGCAKTIEEKLSDMEGVQKAAVDFDKKIAVVDFDATKQTPETLTKAVESAADGKTYTVANLTTSN